MGLGIENPHQWDLGSFQIGYRADLWVSASDQHARPPICFISLEAQWKTFRRTVWTPVIGASVSLIAQKKLWDTGMLFVQVGGKSQGYVPGESLKSSMTLRVGITLW